MTITFIAATQGSANALSYNLTVPTSGSGGTVAVDDTIVLFRSMNSASSAFTALASPWVQVTGSPFVTTSNTTEVWIKKIVAGDLASTKTMAATVSTKHSANMIILRNVHLTTPVHGTPQYSYTTTDTDANYTAPSITTTLASFILEYYTERSSTPSTAATVTGATKRSEVYMTGGSAVSSVTADDGYQATAGTYGGDAIAWSTSNTTKGAVTIALLEVGAGGGGTTGPTLKRWNGTTFKTGGTVKRWNGTTFKTGATIRRWDGSAWHPAP